MRLPRSTTSSRSHVTRTSIPKSGCAPSRQTSRMGRHCGRRSTAPTSCTTSCTRSARPTSWRATARPQRPSRWRPSERAWAGSCTWAGLGDDRPDLSPHLRSRLETAAALASGSVPLTTLRAAVVVGRGSAGFETIVALVDRLPVMVAPRWVSTPTQPIALDDIVRYLAGVASLPETVGETFDVGGPEVMTYREMIERVGRLRGRRPLIVEVPVLSPRLSSLWLHLVTPVRAGVARPLVEGLRNPTVAREDRIRSLLPIQLTAFDDAARAVMR